VLKVFTLSQKCRKLLIFIDIYGGKNCRSKISETVHNEKMKITTLDKYPHLLTDVVRLVEISFEYEENHSFMTDFAPLFDSHNLENHFITLDDNEKVIAHIGVCERYLLNHKIALLGGIAVSKENRGEGIFQNLMREVLSERSDRYALFMLWSDQEKLYKKFGFYLCGNQIELSAKNGTKNFIHTKLAQLSSKQMEELKIIYQKSFSNLYTTLLRTDEDWKNLQRIQSSDLFIKEKDGKIYEYFFMNKGQDLQGVIYEYGTLKDIKIFLEEIRNYGRVWIAKDILASDNLQYQFLLSPGDTKLFKAFVESFTNKTIVIEDINHMKQEVYFHFNEELLGLDTEDFLRGIFGPGVFEEIETNINPLFISGLESI